MPFLSKTVFSCFLFCLLGQAYANIVILGTRIIYPAEQNTISIRLQNNGSSPSLAQAWLDDGTESAEKALSDSKIPFIITPPVSRIDPKTEQTLRVRHIGRSLPADRESLFYLNVLDIPAKPAASKTQNYLQITVRNRLKFFYRPAHLPYPVEEAYTKVQWRLAGHTLHAANPTPYYITYSALGVQNPDGSVVPVGQTAMIAPFSQHDFTLPQTVSGSHVQWKIINDYGGLYQNTSPLQR